MSFSRIRIEYGSSQSVCLFSLIILFFLFSLFENMVEIRGTLGAICIYLGLLNILLLDHPLFPLNTGCRWVTPFTSVSACIPLPAERITEEDIKCYQNVLNVDGGNFKKFSSRGGLLDIVSE